jgi:hypothetical protein
MSELPHDAEELSRIYASRFEGQKRYLLAVWRILIETVFARWIRSDQTVLYCKLPCVWPLFGKQFIVVLRKP